MSEDVEGGGKGVLSSALLVAAVSAILLTGFILKNDLPTASARSATAALPAPPLPLGSAIMPDAAPESAAPPEEAVPEAPPEAVPAAAIAEAPAAAAPETKPVAAQPAPAPDPTLLKLATRADRDRGRLAKSKGRWTAQLVVACRPETVLRLLNASGTSASLYVLPARVKEDACFRVCYGSYATSKDAAEAADLPKALRGKEKPAAVEIAKVLL